MLVGFVISMKMTLVHMYFTKSEDHRVTYKKWRKVHTGGLRFT